MMIVGPSGSGKTHFTERLLCQNLDLFQSPPKAIHYCYGAWQDGFKRMKKTAHPVSRRDSRVERLGQMVSPRGHLGHGRLDGRRGKRQARLGSLHQTFPSSKHHGLVSVPRHVSGGEICKEHFQKRALHRGLQEPAR